MVLATSSRCLRPQPCRELRGASTPRFWQRRLRACDPRACDPRACDPRACDPRACDPRACDALGYFTYKKSQGLRPQGPGECAADAHRRFDVSQGPRS
jgi:hypothetical protein